VTCLLVPPAEDNSNILFLENGQELPQNGKWVVLFASIDVSGGTLAWSPLAIWKGNPLLEILLVEATGGQCRALEAYIFFCHS